MLVCVLPEEAVYLASKSPEAFGETACRHLECQRSYELLTLHQHHQITTTHTTKNTLNTVVYKKCYYFWNSYVKQ